VRKPETKGCTCQVGGPLFWDEHELFVLRAIAACTTVLAGDSLSKMCTGSRLT